MPPDDVETVEEYGDYLADARAKLWEQAHTYGRKHEAYNSLSPTSAWSRKWMETVGRIDQIEQVLYELEARDKL